MIEFTEELYQKYNKLLWNRVKKKMDQQDRNVTWRITHDDLHSEAVIAMANACEKFDPERGCRFSTYLTTAVDNQLNAYLRNHSRAFSVSQKDNDKVRYLIAGVNSGKTIKELAAELKIPEEEAMSLYNINLNSYSVDFQIDGGDKNDMPFENLISNNNYDDEYSDEITLIKHIIDTCPYASKIDKEIYFKSKGLFGYRKEPAGVLAKQKGLSIFKYKQYIAEVSTILEVNIKRGLIRYRNEKNK